MVRRAQMLGVLGAMTTLLLALLAVMTPAEAAEDDDLPLAVTITSLSPSTLPASGPVTISGTVTNTSTQEYRVIRVYGLTSTTPITSRAELAEAAESSPTVDIGDRITARSASIDALAPGEQRPYSLTIPRRLLPIGADSTPGVYWLGVHALGETDDGRLPGADGKARTFMPLITDQHKSVDAALVMSLRHEVRYRSSGRVAGLDRWRTDLSPGGRLADLIGFGQAAGDRPLTWLVDPAVTDAVRRLAAGNPAQWLGRTRGDDFDQPLQAAAAVDADRGRPTDPVAATAADWLGSATSALSDDQLLALPYGDVDVSAAARWSIATYQQARASSGRSIVGLDLHASPVVAPPDGYLDPDALSQLPTRTTVLLGDQMVPGDQKPTVIEADGRSFVASDQAVSTGGPRPGERTAPLQIRQRILSDAALRLLAGDGPLVVTLPSDWDTGGPVDADEFFTGLDVPWLHLTRLRAIVNRTPAVVEANELTYPEARADEELPGPNFGAASALVDDGQLMQSVLPTNHTIAEEVRRQALTSTSYASRGDPEAARERADIARERLLKRLGRVTVEAPSSVTLSSDSGRFSAIITNGMAERVRVQVVGRSDGELAITPSEVIELAPGELATVELTASSRVLGLHDVTLLVTDADGQPLGGQARFPLRAAQVSSVIWVVFAVGAALLFGAIAVRLVRRIRGALQRRSAAS
ncbi:MAG: hypothetical protein QM714_13555 [Nocardioides sp.]|uniref:hypothetical protein n=1 Tax=Nocardioides sp. TaxID=35761 RepID=UPI0039E5C697